MARGGEPAEQAHRLHEVFEAVLAGETTARPRGRSSPRHGGAASPRTWIRTAAPRRSWCGDTDLPDLRAAHPLNEVMPLLRSTLVSIADEAMHVMLVTDADGVILWREGAAKAAASGRRGGVSARAPAGARK